MTVLVNASSNLLQLNQTGQLAVSDEKQLIRSESLPVRRRDSEQTIIGTSILQTHYQATSSEEIVIICRCSYLNSAHNSGSAVTICR
jgi:hypothetical protein